MFGSYFVQNIELLSKVGGIKKKLPLGTYLRIGINPAKMLEK